MPYDHIIHVLMYLSVQARETLTCIGLTTCRISKYSRQARQTNITFTTGPLTLRLLHSPAMADKVKEVAVGEADRIKSLTVQAARSAAYLYPIKASY